MINRYKNNLISFFLIAAIITVSLFFLDILIGPKYGGDIEWYIAAAQGHWNELIQPYSARFLHPFIVGFISRHLPFDLYKTFSVVAIVSLFLFFITNIVILKSTIKKPLFLIPLFFLPFFYDTLRYIFHPDTFYIFLTALFFLFLFYKKEALSLIILFLLFLTRESTIILGLILVIISWLRSKKLFAIATLVVVGISLFITGSISSIGQSNIHHLGNLAYTIFKFFYNFLANVLGIRGWVDTYTACSPIFKFKLPHFNFFGSIHEVGFCGFDFSLPLYTLLTLLTIFGIGPLILFYCFKKGAKKILKELPFWAVVALIYGLAFYFIGISAGTGVQRIVGYGWPAFLLVTPFLVRKIFIVNKSFVIKLSAFQLFVVWFIFVIQKVYNYGLGSTIFSVLVAGAAYYQTLRIIKGQDVVA